MKDLGYHYEQIRCPECKKVQTAAVIHTEPWYTYIHNCDCGYIIMESDWYRIKTNDDENKR